MARNTNVHVTKVTQHGGVKFTNADAVSDVNGTNSKTVLTATGGDCILNFLSGTSSSVGTAGLMIFLYDPVAAVHYLIGTQNLPANSGFVSGTTAVNLLSDPNLAWIKKDKDQNNHILLKSGWSLKVGVTALPGVGQKMVVFGTIENYQARSSDAYYTLDYNDNGTIFTDADAITDVDGANTKTLFTADADDSIIRSCGATTSEVAGPKDIMLFASDGVTKYLLGITQIIATAGFSGGTATKNVFNFSDFPFLTRDKNGNRKMNIGTGWTLQAGLKTTLNPGKRIILNTTGENY